MIDLQQPNYRRRRAEMITASIMRVLEDYIPNTARPRAWDALTALFVETDAEIIGEGDRLAAGLPARNENGLSPQEHAIIESQRALALVKPPHIYICAKCGELPK